MVGFRREGEDYFTGIMAMGRDKSGFGARDGATGNCWDLGAGEGSILHGGPGSRALVGERALAGFGGGLWGRV